MKATARFSYPIVNGLKASIAPGEVRIEPGVPSLHIENLPPPAGTAARDNISAALSQSDLTLPKDRLVVTLPTHDPWQPGPKADLPIAIATLTASGQIPQARQPSLYLGNLEPDGRISPTPATVSIAAAARHQHAQAIYVPSANAAEAALTTGITVYPVDTLRQLVQHLRGETPIAPWRMETDEGITAPAHHDFAAIPASASAKRAVLIAAAGKLPVMLSGPAGAGKTLLARAIPSLMPRLSPEDALECAIIRSLAGQNNPDSPLSTQPPFRSPHYTISHAGLAGGGRSIKPGELSLSHRGVLFLDELPEFNQQAQSTVCQALSNRSVEVTKITAATTYPADFLMVTGMQPCPCGYLNVADKTCVCTPQAAARYQRRVSSDLASQIALFVNLEPIHYGDHAQPTGESSETIRKRVAQAWQFQADPPNPPELLTPKASAMLRAVLPYTTENEVRRRNAIAVARAIADLEQSATVGEEHLAEALSYQFPDTPDAAIPKKKPDPAPPAPKLERPRQPQNTETVQMTLDLI